MRSGVILPIALMTAWTRMFGAAVEAAEQKGLAATGNHTAIGYRQVVGVARPGKCETIQWSKSGRQFAKRQLTSAAAVFHA